MRAESCAAGPGGQSRRRPCREVRGQRDGFIGIDNGLENSPTAKKKDGNYAPKLKVYKKGRTKYEANGNTAQS